MRAFLTLLVLLSTLAIPAAAQVLPGLGTQAAEAEAEETGIEETLRLAREQGLTVVIVDPDGNVLNAPSGPPDNGAEAAPERGSPLMALQAQGDDFRSTLRERLDALPGSVTQVAYVLRAISPDGRIMTYVEVLGFTLLLLFAGRLFVRYVYGPVLVKRFVVARIMEAPEGYREKMPFLVFRFFMGIVGTLLTMLVAYVLGVLIFPPVEDETVQVTILAIYLAFFVARFIGDLWRMILSPFLEQYRIPAFSERDAKILYYWLFTVAALDVWVIAFSTWLSDFGLVYNVYAAVYGVLSLGIALLNIAMILANRAAVSNAIRNGRPAAQVSRMTRTLSQVWAPLLILYVLVGWGELAVDLVLELPQSVPLLAGLYAVVMSIIVVYGLINYGIESYFERSRRAAALSEAPVPAAPDAPIHMDSYEDLARRVSGILAFVAGMYALVSIWGGSATEMVGNNRIVLRALDIVVILFIGYVAYHAFRIWIDGKIAEEQGDMPEAELGDEGGGSSASRLATLLPLFRAFILIVIVVTVVLIILLELGVNVSPLFAGAGIVGVAVGFGSQALVRDIFSGAFFLFDDAFRKGEYIDTGGVKGTVEKISVRSFQLRHHLGALHTIPFGEIQVLTNYSRDWVMMKLPLRVTYDTDVDRVRKLVKKLGQQLMDDPVIGEDFIQPLKSQGVIEMQDSAMIIRVKFMTKPGDQWVIRKRVYEEIRALFEREGIKFAHREVTVRIAEDQQHLPEDRKRAAIAAAEAGIEEDLLEAGAEAGDDDR
ncbi:MAG: mechanosensitive ion channel family protein [Pseudomonadota bacterium]